SRRVHDIPRVANATETLSLPAHGGPRSELVIPGKTHAEEWNVTFEACSDTSSQVMDRRLLRGTLLSENDIESARPVSVINQTLARDFFGKDDPIGQKISFKILDQIPETPHGLYLETIGIVSYAKNRGLQEPIMPD